MRILRFLLIFLGTALLIVGSIFYINRDVFITVFQNRTAILEGSEWVDKTYSLGGLISYMAEQPGHVSMASMSASLNDSRNNKPVTNRKIHPKNNLSTNHVPDAADSFICIEPDQPVPAGTLSHFILFATYAEQVILGLTSPRSSVEVDKLKSFYLPGLDQGHRQRFEQWLRTLPEPPDLEMLIRYLAHNRDPAAGDYLFFRLGEEAVLAMTERLGGGCLEPPVPLYGIRTQALTPQREPGLDHENLSARLGQLSDIPREKFLRKSIELAHVQWVDPQENKPVSIRFFQDERALYRLYPAVCAGTFSRMLLGIWKDHSLGYDVSRKIRNLLEEASQDRTSGADLKHYSSFFDERMSYLSGWSIATDPDDNVIRTQVILFHDIPPGLWFHMNSNFMTRDYHHRMLYDPEIRKRTTELVGRLCEW